MKNTILSFFAAIFTVVVASSANGQLSESAALQHPVFDGISEFSRSHLAAQLAAPTAGNSLDEARAGFCLTNNQQDFWDDTDWQPFSRYVSSCDNNGNSVDQASESNATGSWTKSYRWLRSYNSAGNLTEWVRQLGSSGEYVNSTRDVHTYNELGYRSMSLDQDWDGTKWVDTDRSTTTFNSEGLAESDLEEKWDGSQWVNVERNTATDNGNGSYTYLTEVWDGATWQPSAQQLYESTDASNYQFVFQLWSGTDWTNDSRITAAPPEFTVEMWDGSAWVGVQKQIEVRDASNRRTELLEQNWVASAWQNDYRATYEFDPTSGTLTEFVLENWDGSAFVPDNRIGYLYDADGNRIEDLWQEYDGSVWVNLLRYTTAWQPVGGVAVENEPLVAEGIQLFQSFPNPASSNATIRFDLERSADVNVTLVDLLGRQRAMLVSGSMPTGSHEIVVDVRDLATGTYFYKLTSGNTVLAGSMIVKH